MGAGASTSYQPQNWRERAVVEQVRAHGEVCRRLERNGHSCEPMFAQAINKAKSNNVISSAEEKHYRKVNRHGNKSKHQW